MLGSCLQMNYLPKFSDLINIASYFCTKYNFEVEYKSEGIQGMGCALIVLKHDTYPKIKIEMDRYFINFQLVLKEDTSLVSIYKFFHPKELLRNSKSYRKKKNFYKYYIEDQNKYFKDYLQNQETFDYKQFIDFYEKYPFNVWKWIE